MTHDELVERGRRYLRDERVPRCRPVLAQPVAPDVDEQPDVIGWDNEGRGVVIECKTSHADFLADLRKPFRAKGVPALGTLRYYLTAEPLVIESFEAERMGWGLLEVTPNGILRMLPAQPYHAPYVAHGLEKLILAAAVCNQEREGHDANDARPSQSGTLSSEHCRAIERELAKGNVKIGNALTTFAPHIPGLMQIWKSGPRLTGAIHKSIDAEKLKAFIFDSVWLCAIPRTGEGLADQAKPGALDELRRIEAAFTETHGSG
jgi:hypothetical protein